MTRASSRPTSLTRRRAIGIMASAVALPSQVAAGDVQRWRGRALGGEVSLDLHGATAADLAAARDALHEIEERFSLYRPTSEVSRLNARGGGPVSPDMADLLTLCGRMHAQTGGLFDPTMQSVFAALLRGDRPDWHSIGWDRVRVGTDRVDLAPGQSLSFNGIAQGYATDRVRDILHARGLSHALVSIGEHAALGGPFRLGLEDPQHGLLGQITLTDGAVATSSPGAMRLGAHAHILHPGGGPALWSTVSVTARSAAIADALSTALCLAPKDQVARIAGEAGVAVTLVDRNGDLTTLG